jgi:hypothetical protein
MKPIPQSRVAEMCCDVTLLVTIILIGCTTAGIWRGMTVPSNQHRFDIVDEIHNMALLLNVGLPVALLTLAASTTFKILRKSFELIPFLLASAGALGVSACALAMYGCFVAGHPGVNLWSQIWWRFTS